MLALLILAQLLPFWGPRADGQRGNDHYAEARYPEAAAAYREGLDALDDHERLGRVAGALWNNLGLTLFRQEAYDEALDAFARAALAAEDAAARSRTLYNAGNAAYAAADPEQALAHYRGALLADPANEQARFNYEFVARRMEQQNPPEEEQEQQDREEPPEPSAYALMLKERADALVAERRYREAHRLLAAGRRTDPTVAAFQDYIRRLDDVAAIDEGRAALERR